MDTTPATQEDQPKRRACEECRLRKLACTKEREGCSRCKREKASGRVPEPAPLDSTPGMDLDLSFLDAADLSYDFADFLDPAFPFEDLLAPADCDAAVQAAVPGPPPPPPPPPPPDSPRASDMWQLGATDLANDVDVTFDFAPPPAEAAVPPAPHGPVDAGALMRLMTGALGAGVAAEPGTSGIRHHHPAPAHVPGALLPTLVTAYARILALVDAAAAAAAPRRLRFSPVSYGGAADCGLIADRLLDPPQWRLLVRALLEADVYGVQDNGGGAGDSGGRRQPGLQDVVAALEARSRARHVRMDRAVAAGQVPVVEGSGYRPLGEERPTCLRIVDIAKRLMDELVNKTQIDDHGYVVLCYAACRTLGEGDLANNAYRLDPIAFVSLPQQQH
ncbi:hypothetical protein P8C59_007569 [Phyllachora maydis]|uniref:Zn(2)-C6 fungal-type domain-containing protein n=1 Tax=Phyllachora maydis TaxID=1825666 RepID=A0AAD9MH33_9PEZI|nr:hypothetical protein P8C59_007569 [Phyllachora maydis]